MNFNPPTPRGVGLSPARPCMPSSRISIHPPREGWDRFQLRGHQQQAISIHPPREGWDAEATRNMMRDTEFQSTHPARGGTARFVRCPFHQENFNPPTPRGVGRHAARRGRQSHRISIHPPREGWDAWASAGMNYSTDFNPPTPRGVGRDENILEWLQQPAFQSTHPARGGTEPREQRNKRNKFQSTHPARGGTVATLSRLIPFFHFNPPTPRGVGHCGLFPGSSAPISIHPPREGWDRCNVVKVDPLLSFQSTHPARGGTLRSVSGVKCTDFNPPTPRGVGPCAPCRRTPH